LRLDKNLTINIQITLSSVGYSNKTLLKLYRVTEDLVFLSYKTAQVTILPGIIQTTNSQIMMENP